MQQQHYQYYDTLLRLLDRVKRHLRAVRLGERLMLFVGVALGVPVLAVLLELAFHPTVPSVAGAFHLMLWAIYALAGTACLVALAAALLHRTRYEQIAVHIERKFPRLDNALINSVQLGKDAMVAGSPLAGKIIADTVRTSQAYEFSQSVSKKRLARAAAAALLCSALFSLMVIGAHYSPRVENAVERLLNPFRYTPVIGSVQILAVEPGDTSVFYGEDLTVTAAIHSQSDVTGLMTIRPEGQQEFETRIMSPIGPRRLGYRRKNVLAPFTYRLKIGDTETREYRVTVARRPEVERLDLVYSFPPYTKLESQTDSDSRGNIRAVKGTQAELNVTSSKKIASGHIMIGGETNLPLAIDPADAARAAATITLTEDTFYTIHISDEHGYTNKQIVSRTITALPDRAPVIRFTEPGREITAAPGETIRLALRVADDFGLAQTVIYFQEADGKAVRKLHEWADIERKEFMPSYSWHLDAAQYAPGTKVVYFAKAVDNNAISQPSETLTDRFTINIEDPEKKIAEKKEEISTWENQLSEILKAQRLARYDSRDAEQLDLAGRRKAGAALKLKQTAIRKVTVDLAENIKAGDRITQRVKEVLFHLTGNEMVQAIKNAEILAAAADNEAAGQVLAGLEENQDAIIAAIEQIFGVLPDIVEQLTTNPDLDDGYDMPSDVAEKLRDLADKLKEFAKEQKKVIDTTADLAKRPVDDFTEEDEKALEDLIATEDKWSRFMKEAFSDLSKLPVQDFSNPSMLEELIEIQSEVEMAKDALKAKAVEIATALEDNGVELAEALTTHIEKWLPDMPDRLQWKMEEALGDYETPMAELPKELEDLIGDLMEMEEDLFEDMEDASSTWADSLDKGAGWGALDGPIQNMSAQGVTGNMLPNSSEIGGRSGEGRTGKSSGEFVEETATGKGGRNTPTRLTPDPFEKGVVKDTSNAAPGGATGGGKISGAAQEGMEGPVPPEIELKLKSLAKRQAAIRNKAEKISARFEVARWPSMFKETTANLKAIEEDLSGGRYQSALRKRGIVLKQMTDTRRFVSDQLQLNSDWSSKLPTRVQDDILDSFGGKAPRGYEDLIQQYYQALSKAE